jgi:uncharacterized SAM-binding protein YcdF (DUF218 family)
MGKERVALLHSYLADRKTEDKPVEEKLSEPQIRRLKTLLDNPPEKDIVVDAKTVTTEGEIKTFSELAEENDWSNLVTIGNDVHLPRIKREIEKTFGKRKVEARSSKEILSQYSRYSSILADTEKWQEQKALALQEKILMLPILGRLILGMAPYLSHSKVTLQSWVFKQLEKRKF